MDTPIKKTLRAVFGRIIRIYFRRIEVAGDVANPATAGRLFIANHVNGLVDPILVLTTAPCAISPIGKSTLWNIPGLRWLLDAAGAVPIVRRRDAPGKSAEDNDRVFQKISEHLGSGGNILIFPEGTSHNEPHLVPFRTGAARMLAKAAAESSREITFQAVGLEFDARDTFRSSVLVLFGPVRNVREFQESGDALPAAITARMKEDLSSLLIESTSWDERMALFRVAEMFANNDASTSLLDRHDLGLRATQFRTKLAASNAGELESIVGRVNRYFSHLGVAGTTDAFVARGIAFDRFRALRGAALLLLLPISIIGMLAYWLPYQIPRMVGRMAKGDHDVVSTYKLGAGLAVYPIWFACLAAVAFLTLPPLAASLLSGALLVIPFAALPYVDREDSLRATLALMQPGILEALRAERRELMTLLEQARDRLS